MSLLEKRKVSQKSPGLHLGLISWNFVTWPPLIRRKAEKTGICLAYCCPDCNLHSLSKHTGEHECHGGKPVSASTSPISHVFVLICSIDGESENRGKAHNFSGMLLSSQYSTENVISV